MNRTLAAVCAALVIVAAPASAQGSARLTFDVRFPGGGSVRSVLDDGASAWYDTAPGTRVMMTPTRSDGQWIMVIRTVRTYEGRPAEAETRAALRPGRPVTTQHGWVVSFVRERRSVAAPRR